MQKVLQKIKKVFSSNINEFIRAVLNFFFFFTKDFAHTKSTKNIKSIKSTKSTKSTKRHKDARAKAQNANKEISDYFPFDVF